MNPYILMICFIILATFSIQWNKISPTFTNEEISDALRAIGKNYSPFTIAEFYQKQEIEGTYYSAFIKYGSIKCAEVSWFEELQSMHTQEKPCPVMATQKKFDKDLDCIAGIADSSLRTFCLKNDIFDSVISITKLGSTYTAIVKFKQGAYKLYFGYNSNGVCVKKGIDCPFV